MTGSLSETLNVLLKVIILVCTLSLISCSNSSSSNSANSLSSFDISGQITNLQGSLTLLNNDSESLIVNSAGGFSFTSQLDEGENYNVTVQTQPGEQICTVQNGSGLVDSSNITTILISCVTNTYVVGGMLNDLQDRIILQNNGTETLAVNSSGSFNFSTPLILGDSYDVTVQAQPSGQTCTVSNGSGLVGSASISNILISCVTHTFSVGGIVSGLIGSITLQINSSETLTVSSSGSFNFSTPLIQGASYDVTVRTQPSGQACTVSNGSGLVASASISNISINCVTQTFTVGGYVSGLMGSIILRNNSNETLTVSSSGSFNFNSSLIQGASYDVTVETQPSGQTCTVTEGSGLVLNSDITNIAVSCVTSIFRIGGTVSGLSGTVIVQNNAGESLSLSSSGEFSFVKSLINGAVYNVTVLNQPLNQTCTISDGDGTVAGSDINNIGIICITDRFSMGGSLSGLQGSITLLNNNSESLTLSSSGEFSFNNPVDDGASYSVTVQTQPAGQFCSVSNAGGIVNGAPVSNISVACVTSPFSIGGTVSGLSGTLSIQNNNGSLLSVSSNGDFVFVQKMNDSEIYNVQIQQNPVDQVCSIANASGQINNANVANVSIVCSASSVTVSISGSYQSAPLIQVDSDINDPFAEANIDNGSPATAQAISNFTTVQGFATKSGTGRVSEGDRFASTADEFDEFIVGLQQNQELRLQVVDFAGTDVFLGDLDLYLYDSTMKLVGFSDSADEFENITVPADGEYHIVIKAFSGTSKYTLSLDGVSVANKSIPQSLDFKTGEAIIQFNKSSTTDSLMASQQLMVVMSHADASRVTKVKFAQSNTVLQSTTQLQQADFERELEQRNPESYAKYKTLLQIKLLGQRQDIQFAEPNYIFHPSVVPDDQFYSLQWHYPAINLAQAWDITTGSGNATDVIVAVVDTGVFLAHPEFSGQLVSGYDFISDIQMAADGNGIDSNPDDPGDSTQLNNSSWHGTHVAGTVAALSNNNASVAGVAWGAKIMPVRALGVGGGTGYDIIQSIRYAAGLSNDSNTVPSQKADIINLSLGGGSYSQAAQEAYNAVRAEGVIVVAAAGNENTSQLSYPASYDGVISVSATDFANVRAPYSNFGNRIDVAAPGGNMGADLNNDGYGDGILSTLVDDSTGIRTSTLSFYQGTSMASPHMAGVLALMRAVHPALSPDNVDSLLSSGAMTTDIGSSGRDDLYGFGLIDALKAVQAAQVLQNGGTAPQQPALIVASPNQLTMGLSSSALLTLSNLGDLPTDVTSFSADVSWLSISENSIDANGLGSYQVLINRNGLTDSTYVGAITFYLATGSSLNVQVTMQVGAQDNSGNSGNIYILLLDTSYSVIDQALAVDQGNGVFDYSFSNVAAGSYLVIAGSDIDNDLYICQLAEACGGYPTIETLTTIEAVNTDITGLDFVINILANFGASSLSVEPGSNSGGFLRQSVNLKQLTQ